MRNCLILFLLLLYTTAHGQSTLNQDSTQIQYSINDSWIFFKDASATPVPLDELGDRKVEIVNLPHSFNTEDAIQDATSKTKGFYRGPAWYIRKVTVPSAYKDKELYVYFEGANQETDVFVNGQFVGNHVGGYTRFVFPISKFVDFEKAGDSTTFELAVRVDTTYNPDVPTLQADFTFYGGIYRDVFLIAEEKVHFNIEDHASNGVYIRTPSVSAQQAELEVDVQIKNSGATDRNVRLETIVFGPDSEKVTSCSSQLQLDAGKVITAKPEIEPIQSPLLWSPDSPNLYRLVCKIYDADSSQLLDQVMNPVGFRWFSFDADQGFFINGKHLKLVGTNRHQDYVGIGNALPDYIHREDVKKMKEMGSNFLRIAHYPQDPSILELCDRLGILTTIETPIIDVITESEAFKQNCLNIHLEMMRQNYNHPSLIVWAYMNEVLLHPKFRKDKQRQEIYFKKVYEIASELEALTRKEDPFRYTMIPNHGSLGAYQKAGLTELPMIVAWNLYYGWYKGKFSDLRGGLEKFHQTLPDKPLIVSEYGAGADPRLHATDPKRFDFTVEYATRYHEEYVKTMMDLPFVAGMNVWNFADFGSVGRVDTVPNINNKGLLGIDRKPKDAYFFYQATFLDRPFIGIAAKTWIRRAGVEDNPGEGICSIPVQVFSNEGELELFHNGVSLGTQAIGEFNKAIWQVPFVDGNNTLRAISIADNEVEDCAAVRMDVQPISLDEFSSSGLSINCGDYRSFYDDKIDQAWLPEKEYSEGSWGWIGGEVNGDPNASRQTVGTNQPIKGTHCDPLYQTQRVGIKQYRFDVPPGMYEVTLHLAELTGKETAALPYELSGSEKDSPAKGRTREFAIHVNGKPVVEQINLKKDYGSFRAVSIKTFVSVENGDPLILDFVPKKGDAVINGIQLNKKL